MLAPQQSTSLDRIVQLSGYGYIPDRYVMKFKDWAAAVRTGAIPATTIDDLKQEFLAVSNQFGVQFDQSLQPIRISQVSGGRPAIPVPDGFILGPGGVYVKAQPWETASKPVPLPDVAPTYDQTITFMASEGLTAAPVVSEITIMEPTVPETVNTPIPPPAMLAVQQVKPMVNLPPPPVEVLPIAPPKKPDIDIAPAPIVRNDAVKKPEPENTMPALIGNQLPIALSSGNPDNWVNVALGGLTGYAQGGIGGALLGAGIGATNPGIFTGSQGAQPPGAQGGWQTPGFTPPVYGGGPQVNINTTPINQNGYGGLVGTGFNVPAYPTNTGMATPSPSDFTMQPAGGPTQEDIARILAGAIPGVPGMVAQYGLDQYYTPTPTQQLPANIPGSGPAMMQPGQRMTFKAPAGYVLISRDWNGNGQSFPMAVRKDVAKFYGYKKPAKPPISVGEWNAHKKAKRVDAKLARIAKSAGACPKPRRAPARKTSCK